MDEMSVTSQLLKDALVRAYRPYVEARLAALEVSLDHELSAALDEAECRLDAELTTLLSSPFAEQRRGPLEVFQEAMGPPTDQLERRGVAPVPRDPVAANALPGDVFDLAPASSSLLGDEVWQAHLVWGAAKAAGLAGGRS
jgi:hypothetical protein